MAWASEAEKRERFLSETFATYDFRVYDEWDNGEFLTGATVDLIERGMVVHTETFVASSEDAPGEGFSAYGNGRDNHALTRALSYANAWIESMETPFEVRFAPFGMEWERERAHEERMAYA
jgi:hypothetical protein